MTRLLRNSILFICGSLFWACGGGRDTASTLIVYQPDVERVRAAIEEWGFPEASSSPNEYMSDFFGIQRLNDDLTSERVIEDFVPAFGTVVSPDTAAVLAVRMNWGVDVEFFFDAAIDMNGAATDRITFGVLADPAHGRDPSVLAAEFRSFLGQHGLSATYLAPNPYYDDELVAFLQMHIEEDPVAVGELADFAEFLQEEHAVYLVPDNVHGNQERYDLFVDFMSRPAVDWIALEMIDATLQDHVANFVTAPESSEQYSTARRALVDYYSRTWNDAFGAERPDANHYLALLQKARELGKSAYALDVTFEYQLFRYGEFPLGSTTRNVLWARQIPATGRGVVFGGSAHMSIGEKGNVQSFMRTANPDLPIYHYYVDNPPS
jgi:hypothetical protein